MSLFGQGQRINITRKANGHGTEYDFRIRGGRVARRINERQVYLTCGDCGEDVLIQRRDQEPLSSRDVLEALSAWEHTCGETS